MSKFNSFAYTPEAIALTRDWLRRTSPLVFLYAKSGKGKTHLSGSLFRHSLYHRVLLIDVDQGTGTIAEYALNQTICDFQPFDKVPEERLGWFNKMVAYARKAECGAIIIEGFTSIHSGMVSANLEKISKPEGIDAMAAHAGPTNRTGALIESLRSVKQYRLATQAGVPIIVTLNTREVPVRPGELNSPKKVVPDWSPNLTDKAMRAADAFIEFDRGPHGTVLYTQQTPEQDARKLRASVPLGPKDPNRPDAARLVQQQVDLELPGLFALWAQADATMREHVINVLTQHQKNETT